MSSSWIQLPGDKNVTWKIEEKENTYGPLLRNLQILYPEYSYQFIPVIIGALSSIPCDLKYNLKCLDFFVKEVNKQIKMLQIKNITGLVKIVKSFLKFKWVAYIHVVFSDSVLQPVLCLSQFIQFWLVLPSVKAILFILYWF